MTWHAFSENGTSRQARFLVVIFLLWVIAKSVCTTEGYGSRSADIYIYMYIIMDIYIYISFVCVSVCVCMYVCMHVRMYLHTCIRIYTCIYVTHTHTHSQKASTHTNTHTLSLSLSLSLSLFPGHIKYAVLDVYALCDMYTKYIQTPVKDSVSLFVSELSISTQVEDEFGRRGWGLSWWGVWAWGGCWCEYYYAVRNTTGCSPHRYCQNDDSVTKKKPWTCEHVMTTSVSVGLSWFVYYESIKRELQIRPI